MPELGFTCREYMGTEIYKPGDMETRLTKKDDVKAGVTVLVPGLGHAWWLMIVKEEGGVLYGHADKMMAVLEYDQDDRHCWVCGGLINTRGLQKLTLSSV